MVITTGMLHQHTASNPARSRCARIEQLYAKVKVNDIFPVTTSLYYPWCDENSDEKFDFVLRIRDFGSYSSPMCHPSKFFHHWLREWHFSEGWRSFQVGTRACRTSTGKERRTAEIHKPVLWRWVTPSHSPLEANDFHSFHPKKSVNPSYHNFWVLHAL